MTGTAVQTLGTPHAPATTPAPDPATVTGQPPQALGHHAAQAETAGHARGPILRVLSSVQKLVSRALAPARPGRKAGRRREGSVNPVAAQAKVMLRSLASGTASAEHLAADLRRLAILRCEAAQGGPAGEQESFEHTLEEFIDHHFPREKLLELAQAFSPRPVSDAQHTLQGTRSSRDEQAIPADAQAEKTLIEMEAVVLHKAAAYRALPARKLGHEAGSIPCWRSGTPRRRSRAGPLLKNPALKAALADFRQARDACRFRPEATEAQLQHACKQLDGAGDRLLEVLIAVGPTGGQLLEAINRRYALDLTQAKKIKPCNQAQADLYTQLAPTEHERSPGELRAVAKVAQELRARIMQDALERPAGERSAATRRSTSASWGPRKPRCRRSPALPLPPQADLDAESEQIQAQHDSLRAAVDRLPTALNGASKTVASDPTDYAAARDALREASTAADGLVKTHVRILEAQAAGAGQRTPVVVRKKPRPAIKLVEDTTDRGAAATSPGKSSGQLLLEVRAKHVEQPTSNDRKTLQFRRAQSKIYRATSLDPGFLAREKALRVNLLGRLRSIKGELWEARARWPRMSETEKGNVLRKIVAMHAGAFGFEPPSKVVLSARWLQSWDATWYKDSRTIVFNTDSTALDDFETAVNIAFHENSHNWQHQLARDVSSAASKLDSQHPFHDQAQLFATNQSFYDDCPATPHEARGPEDRRAYREQPWKLTRTAPARSWRRAVMRMLDE